MIRIGFTCYSFAQALRAGQMDIFEVIKFAAGLGAQHMELSPGTMFEMNPETIAKIVETAKAVQMPLSSYTIGANFVQ